MPSHTGILNSFDLSRAFGFIFERVIENGKVRPRSFFVHLRDVVEGEPIVNCAAHFDVQETKKGPQAINVVFDPLEQTPAAKENSDAR